MPDPLIRVRDLEEPFPCLSASRTRSLRSVGWPAGPILTRLLGNSCSQSISDLSRVKPYVAHYVLFFSMVLLEWGAWPLAAPQG